jgi:hypothetical protein
MIRMWGGGELMEEKYWIGGGGGEEMRWGDSFYDIIMGEGLGIWDKGRGGGKGLIYMCGIDMEAEMIGYKGGGEV